MQEEKKSKQKKDENLYRKILYTTLYIIYKESLMIINSFGIPKRNQNKADNCQKPQNKTNEAQNQK